jgi:mono/diheme cytochrome c family protein
MFDSDRTTRSFPSSAVNARKSQAPWRLAVLTAACCGAAACMSDVKPQTNTASINQPVHIAATALSPGRTYADKACASCHAVAPGQTRSPNPSAPAFESVANTPGMTAMALNVWLHTSHPTMPNLIIDPTRLDDLAAYLLTLKKQN